MSATTSYACTLQNSAVAEISLMLNTGLRRESYLLDLGWSGSRGYARLSLQLSAQLSGRPPVEQRNDHQRNTLSRETRWLMVAFSGSTKQFFQLARSGHAIAVLAQRRRTLHATGGSRPEPLLRPASAADYFDIDAEQLPSTSATADVVDARRRERPHLRARYVIAQAQAQAWRCPAFVYRHSPLHATRHHRRSRCRSSSDLQDRASRADPI